MGFFDSLFGTGKSNAANAAMPYLNQIPGQSGQYLQPYYETGKAALPELQGQYQQLLGSPGDKLNQIGESFHESPGLKFAIQQALQGGDNAAAAGGMAGSPEHQQHNMELATNLGNQDYYNWLGGATGLYEQGLQGEQGLAHGGFNAGNSLADMIAQTLAQQGNLAFQGQRQQNQSANDMFGNLIKGAGALSAFKPFTSLFGGGQ